MINMLNIKPIGQCESCHMNSKLASIVKGMNTTQRSRETTRRAPSRACITRKRQYTMSCCLHTYAHVVTCNHMVSCYQQPMGYMTIHDIT